MSEFPEEVFPEPPGWAGSPRESLRQHAAAQLLPAIEDAVFLAWRNALPPEAVARCCQNVRMAARAAIRQLSTKPSLARVLLSGRWTRDIPDYWEPAEAPGQDQLLPVQLRAYRWAAAAISNAVLDKLEGLHAKYPADAARSLAVRNAVLDVCIRDPLTGYVLARYLAWLVVIARQPAGKAIQIPHAAGM